MIEFVATAGTPGVFAPLAPQRSSKRPAEREREAVLEGEDIRLFIAHASFASPISGTVKTLVLEPAHVSLRTNHFWRANIRVSL